MKKVFCYSGIWVCIWFYFQIPFKKMGQNWNKSSYSVIFFAKEYFLCTKIAKLFNRFKEIMARIWYKKTFPTDYFWLKILNSCLEITDIHSYVEIKVLNKKNLVNYSSQTIVYRLTKAVISYNKVILILCWLLCFINKYPLSLYKSIQS